MADWADIRRFLTERGFAVSDVVLPGDRGIPADGALQVSPVEGGWTLSTVDYGQTRVLVRAWDENDIAEALLFYVSRPMPEPDRLDPRERERLLSQAAPHLLDLAHRAADGMLIDLPPSLIVNRIGALDGIHLYPAETSFEARSLPPTALGSPVHEFVTAASVRVVASITPPWFGRPGGGIRLTVEDPSRAIRDLVVEGALIPVVPLT